MDEKVDGRGSGSQKGGGVPLCEGGTHAEHSRPNEKHGTQRGLQDSSRMQLLGGVAFFGGDFSQSSEKILPDFA